MSLVVESLRDFTWGVLKHWWLLLPAILLDPLDAAERLLGMTYEVPSWIAWVLAGVGFFIAAFLTYHDLRLKGPPPKVVTKERYPTPPGLPEEEVKRWMDVLAREHRAKGGYTPSLAELRREAVRLVRETYFLSDLTYPGAKEDGDDQFKPPDEGI